MRSDRDWVLWRAYQNAWRRAELLQSLWEGDSMRFGVVYDHHQSRWLANCIDTSQWITQRFRGGHHAYHPEVWRDE